MRSAECGVVFNSALRTPHSPLRKLRQEESNLHFLLNRQADYRYPMPEQEQLAPYKAQPRHLKSTQRESNPHFRHGKAAGYRYIMGALERNRRIVKEPRAARPRCDGAGGI